ncbi:MAG: DNA-directed RNA polymerase subunit omega [Bacillota bacterium]
MQFSSLDKLVRQHSRYPLVVAVAKRARQLLEEGREAGGPGSNKPVTLALNEIADGSVVVTDARPRYR